jgi:very-short-patch-repair endonuclease
VHWDEALRLDAATRLRVSVADALYQVAECASMEDFIVCADSALHQKKVDHRTLTGLLCRLPASFGDARMLWDARAESGIESMARLRLRAAGIPVRVQVAIPTLGRVDLLVGRRLVVELDGKEFHTGEERFESDRRRDLDLAIRGYSVLRFSYQQVLNEWPSCLAAIRAHMERRVHL